MFYTYAYYLVLAIALTYFFILGFLQVNKTHKDIYLTFSLSHDGICIFDDNVKYQMLENSRYSFFGCWLVLKPAITNTALLIEQNKKNKRLFIYRDSLSDSDFSRLSNVISEIHQTT